MFYEELVEELVSSLPNFTLLQEVDTMAVTDGISYFVLKRRVEFEPGDCIVMDETLLYRMDPEEFRNASVIVPLALLPERAHEAMLKYLEN